MLPAKNIIAAMPTPRRSATSENCIAPPPILRAAIPDVEVQGCFVDFEGSSNAGVGIGKKFQEEATLA